MPINAPAEYWKAVQLYEEAKTPEEQVMALEEVIRWTPSHKGAENLRAQWKSKLAKLKKEQKKRGKKGKKTEGVHKEGNAQICIIGLPNAGKSTLLRKITGANVEVADYPYTTTKPAVGMMDYKGIKIQLVEIPATFEPEHMSVAHSTDAIIYIIRNETELKEIESIKNKFFLRAPSILLTTNDISRLTETEIKTKLWNMLGFIIAYTKTRTKKGVQKSPMALKKGSTVKDFCGHIHKDFVKNFRVAKLERGGRVYQVGLDYIIKDGDVIEVKVK